MAGGRPSRWGSIATRSNGLQQEVITPHCPQQNGMAWHGMAWHGMAWHGMAERVIRTIKEQGVHRHRFERLQHATRIIGDWIGFYNHERPHQALNMKTPAEAYALAA